MFWYADIYGKLFSASLKDMPEQFDPLSRQETRREFLGETVAAVVGAPIAAVTAAAIHRGVIVGQMIDILLEAVGPLPLTAEGLAAAERDVLAVKNLGSTGKVIFPSEVIEKMERRVETTRKAFGRATLQQGLNDAPPEEKPTHKIEQVRPSLNSEREQTREVLSKIMGSLLTRTQATTASDLPSPYRIANNESQE